MDILSGQIGKSVAEAQQHHFQPEQQEEQGYQKAQAAEKFAPQNFSSPHRVDQQEFYRALAEFIGSDPSRYNDHDKSQKSDQHGCLAQSEDQAGICDVVSIFIKGQSRIQLMVFNILSDQKIVPGRFKLGRIHRRS